ncbi:hypothetical protein RSOLAG22IIIB_05170 [Rhizoctonia solani]|uniref:Uncharacterized protein n=1 Tax=Rhizoctonia solani TaxID=456999 RepID=A0A0K6G4B3_9AGAM|nr:hypothetical protein RSOLAG22IIIB_05170 [Rhizoctonia solani]
MSPPGAVTPRRMGQLQSQWRDYAAGYLGAIFIQDDPNNVSAPVLQMCPNTPKLDNAISVEEMEAELFETACQASLQEHLEVLAAQELEELMPGDEDEGSHTPRANFANTERN